MKRVRFSTPAVSGRNHDLLSIVESRAAILALSLCLSLVAISESFSMRSTRELNALWCEILESSRNLLNFRHDISLLFFFLLVVVSNLDL